MTSKYTIERTPYGWMVYDHLTDETLTFTDAYGLRATLLDPVEARDEALKLSMTEKVSGGDYEHLCEQEDVQTLKTA